MVHKFHLLLAISGVIELKMNYFYVFPNFWKFYFRKYKDPGIAFHYWDVFYNLLFPFGEV